MRASRPVVGIDFGAQTPLLEHRSFGECVPKWIVWLAYNKDRTAGTYLVLNEDGSVLRETTYPDGGVETVVIKPQSYKRGSNRKVPGS
jgi:hypothetical protein